MVISDLLPTDFTFLSPTSVTLSAGATRTFNNNPTIATNPSWGNFTIPEAESVTIVFNVSIPNTQALGTYQNPATATYDDPARTVAGGTTTTTYNPTSSTNEDVTIIGTDYGDAPDTYGTDSIAGNSTGDPLGASHTIKSTNNPFIGTLVPDADGTNALTPYNGTGDNTTNINDEDAIASFPVINTANTSYSVTFNATNNSGSTANLIGWIDFNYDGKFQSTEAATTTVATGSNNISKTLTWSSISITNFGTTYARFRITTDGAISSNTPGGLASDGEVEDYSLMINPVADLSLTKTVNNATPNVGSNVTFTLTLTNSGPNNTTGVIVKDLLPAGLSYVSSTPSGTTTYNNTTGVWTVGALNNGSSATLDIVAKVTGTAVVNNTAEVTASSLPDPDSTPDNNVSTEDDQASVIIGTIPVKAYKSVKATTDGGTAGYLTQNDIVTWSVFYTNTGTTDIPNFQATDALPAGVTKSGALVITPTGVGQTAPGANINYNGTSNNLFANAVILKAGGTIQIDIPTAINVTTGNICNQGSGIGSGLTSPILSDAVDSDTSALPNGITTILTTTLANSIKQIDNPTIDSTCINITTSPEIIAYKSVKLTTDVNTNSVIDPGDTVTWTVTYVNKGTVDVSNFNVSDTINSDLTYIAPLTITPNTTQGGVITPKIGYNGSGNFFNSDIATFKAGGVITITFQTQINIGVTGTKTNQATGSNGTLTDNIDNTTTALPFGVTVPSGSIPQTQRTPEIDPTSITIGGGTPKIILLKRITGVYRQNTPVVTNSTQLFSQFNNDGADATDNPVDWDINKFPAKDANGNALVGDPPPNPEKNAYLRGAIDGGEVQSNDEIEFTIYFVNKGTANATNVNLCDLVPANLDFVADAYGSGKGVAVSFDATKLNLEPNLFYSNASGDDKGTFYSKGVTAQPQCAFDATTNKDGVVAVDLGTVPFASGQGTPTNSYGFIRFRAKVK